MHSPEGTAATRTRPPSGRDTLEEAFQEFRRAFPDFDSTSSLDELRARDFARLDRQGHVYLDYTGAGLPAESHVRAHMALLTAEVFGNPHSTNMTSMATTALIGRARDRVLAFFNASPDEYDVIFTPNATGALKLVGESYPFAPGGACLLTFDNHNSVNGVREFARAKGAEVTYVPVVPPDLRVDGDRLKREFARARRGANNLFAYPAQSNFSGVQHPLGWIAEAQANGWDVLLDAASFVPCNRLDLHRWHPDYVDLSFYKMFGYPTGTGCLLARKTALGKLRRPWFAGGTIAFSSVQGEGHYLTPGTAGFEDGTVNFLSLPAVETGLGTLESVGMETIHTRVRCLTGWLIRQLLALRHGNGTAAIRLYGPPSTAGRGGTVAFNVFDPDGNMWDCRTIERLASEEGISLRAGCHCNPGAREVALGFTEREMARCFEDQDRLTIGQFLGAIEGKTTGTVRASLGLVTTFADVHRFIRFTETYVDRPSSSLEPAVAPPDPGGQERPHPVGLEAGDCDCSVPGPAATVRSQCKGEMS